MEGILVASGPAFRTGASPRDAELLDIAPTVLHLLGIPVPGDMDGRVLAEILDPSLSPVDLPVSAAALAPAAAHAHAATATPGDSVYTAEEDAEIQRRLEDLGYL
jgi:arylsulfatase A-like enzyme